MMSRSFQAVVGFGSVGLALSLGLTACDHHDPIPQQHAQTEPQRETSAISMNADSSSDQGMSLTDVAGQATLPAAAAQRENLTPPTASDLVYAGRYHLRLQCTDVFASCADGEKETEYILNLLTDGSVYWTNTSFGRLGADTARKNSEIEQGCRQVQWVVHQKLNEIMLHCDAANINVYYQVDANQDLVLDREKSWNDDYGGNRQFFQQYPMPTQPYVFEKVK